MAPRPHWNGFLKLSFVSCPISLYPALSPAERVSFRQVNRKTGNRLRQQLVDAVTGEAVDTFDKARGYEVGAEQFVVVEDEELAHAKQEAKAAPFIAPRAPTGVPEPQPARGKTGDAKGTSSNRTVEAPPLTPAAAPEPMPKPRVEVPRVIEIERFVPIDQIDARYQEKPYYIVPRGPVAQEAFAVIREAMAGQGMAGIGHVVLSSRERPIAIHPLGLGLQGVTLRYPYEVRGEAEYFDDIPPMTLPNEMVDLARHIVTSMKADFEPAMLNDRERAAVIEMLKEKQRTLAVPVPDRRTKAEPSRTNIVNLMDALKRSLAAGQPAAANPSRGKRKPARAE